MKCSTFSYRYGLEILQHVHFQDAHREIMGILKDAPVFLWSGKSAKNKKLDVVQQLLNAYFDRKFAIDHDWSHHPLATEIKGSKLKADFQKTFHSVAKTSISVQAEVQFGNMSRWYSDIFKFQAAYAAKKIQLGLSVVPMASLARRIDSNVVNYERAKRELPSAELSVTLPILLVGLEVDARTPRVDVRQSKFAQVKDITGKNKYVNRRRIVHGYLSSSDIDDIGPDSDPGPEIAPPLPEELEEDES